MNFNSTQQATFKTWLDANAVGLSDQDAANLANQPSSPDYWAWRTSISKHEITDQSSFDTDGTTVTNFTWGGATGGFIARSQGEREAWRELFNSTDSCKPSLANVRTAFNDIFSGAGAGAQGNRAHLWGACQRKVTNAEKLFVTQTVGGPTQTGNRGAKTNPDTLVLEGIVTSQNVAEARG
jgi:hypothetical protein